MSTLPTLSSREKDITPPSSTTDAPLTPPLTDEKPATKVHQVLSLFYAIKAGRRTGPNPWKEFQLGPGEYAQIEREIGRDDSLSGYIKDKLRWVGVQA
jgi:hypothetical protein